MMTCDKRQEGQLFHPVISEYTNSQKTHVCFSQSNSHRHISQEVTHKSQRGLMIQSYIQLTEEKQNSITLSTQNILSFGVR